MMLEPGTQSIAISYKNFLHSQAWSIIHFHIMDVFLNNTLKQKYNTLQQLVNILVNMWQWISKNIKKNFNLIIELISLFQSK